MRAEPPFRLIFKFLQLFLLGTPIDKLVNDFHEADIKTSGDPRFLDKEYDFIVVGGGSAGSTLTGRLSEDENHTVLLLEAGGHQFPLSALTHFLFAVLGLPAVDWRDDTVPQKRTCQAFVNNKAVWSRAKVLGGGSAMNGRLNQRGNPLDFDNWANETNDEQWGYKNLIPYFKKLEDYHGGFPNDEFHAKGGPIPVNPVTDFFAPLAEEFREAGKELGYPNVDPNGHQKDSFFPWDIFIKNGRSYSAYDCFVEPHLDRKNLKIQIFAQVLKVLFDEKDPKRAAGVEFSHFGNKYTVTARKEVILSAGPLGTPQILMLSGVGPRDHLESLGIPVVADLPVGKYLQDHSMTYFGPFTFDKAKSSIAHEDLNRNMANAERWYKNGTGAFAGGGVAFGVISTSPVAQRPDWPDVMLQSYVVTISEELMQTYNGQLDFKPGVIEKYLKNDLGKSALMIMVVMGRPRTMGRLKLKSRNPFELLEIDPNYFEHPDDLTAVLHGMRLSLNVTKTQAFKKMGTKLIDTPFPGCEEFPDHESDDYLLCYIRHWTMTIWHYSSTCRMGKDPEIAVVDSHLRVHGLKGLRVIDSSIFPNVTNSNTNTPTIMVAEKAADLIKSDWSKI